VAALESAAIPRRRPIDLLLGVYAIVASSALLFPHRPATWPFFLLAHAAFSLACLQLPPMRYVTTYITARKPRLAAFLADWYPLLLLAAFYLELGPLNRAVHNGHYFDAIVSNWEQSLFGAHPSSEWAAHMPFLWLSETLHIAYISYYFILYLPAIAIWFRKGPPAFRETIFSLMLVFVVHYVFFIYFPVQGPRYLFPAPQGGIETGFFYRIAHFVLEVGSSQGAAFPSSHVGASAAIAIALLRHLPRAAPPVILLTLGVAAGAVYGGFHYALDVTTGLTLGIVLGCASPALYRLLQKATSERVTQRA
jgi:membrane-associated phospholipid phosphatase